MRIRLSLALTFFAVAPALLFGSPSLQLWPSDLCAAKAHKASSIKTLEAGSIAVETETGYDWPGVTVFFKKGSYDLTHYSFVNIALSNSCNRTLTICLSVKNRPDKESSPGEALTLEPGAAGVMRVRLHVMPWILDAPLELVGMRGFPKAIEDDQFNLRKAAELHLFLNRPTKRAAFTITGIDAEPGQQTIKVLKSKEFLPFVDCFGQFRHDDWPGKIKTEDDLQQAAVAEKKFLDETAAPKNFNQWGGWADGVQLQASGHFRVEKLRGMWWLVDPDGHLFFSHGVNCVQPATYSGIQDRESYFEWLPEENSPFAAFYGWNSWAPHGFYKGRGRHRTYSFSAANMLRKYGEDWRTVYRDMAHRRLRVWGLNTIANWSDHNVYMMRRTPYVVNLGTQAPPIEGSDGWWGKFPDPFHPKFKESIKRSLANSRKTADDPWCIGYFVDNELSWGNHDHALAEAVLKSPAAQPAKYAAFEWLIQKHGNLEKLNQKWGSTYASRDAFLSEQIVPNLDTAADDLLALHELIAAEYFSIISTALKQEAPHKLYLGCRFASGSPASYKVASRYCDVVSFNNYKRLPAKDLPEGSVDKPLINGEFHFGALDRGMFHTGLVAVKDQQERAQAYKDFLIACLHHPRYVGTHWFQWRDQPLTGRGDAENYQIGFLTGTDQPHPELVAAAREIATIMYETRMAQSLAEQP
jgi:hypothetical protein